MNKAQAKIAWVMVILLSVISAFYEIARTVQNVNWGHYEPFSNIFIFTLVIPILLIFDLVFLCAKDKAQIE